MSNAALHHGAERDPFGLTANPDCYVETAAIERVLQDAVTSLDEGHVPVIGGPTGLGKTLVLQLLGRLRADRSRPLYIPFCTLGPEDLAAFALGLLEHQAGADPEADLMREVQRLSDGGHSLLLLIDDAAALPGETAAQLAHWTAASEGALQVVLAGLPGPALRHARDAFGDQAEELLLLAGLRSDEIPSYVRARLDASAVNPEQRDAFTDDVMRELARVSEGNPRRLNLAAQAVMRHTRSEEQRSEAMEADQLSEVAEDLVNVGAYRFVRGRFIDPDTGDAPEGASQMPRAESMASLPEPPATPDDTQPVTPLAPPPVAPLAAPPPIEEPAAPPDAEPHAYDEPLEQDPLDEEVDAPPALFGGPVDGPFAVPELSTHGPFAIPESPDELASPALREEPEPPPPPAPPAQHGALEAFNRDLPEDQAIGPPSGRKRPGFRLPSLRLPYGEHVRWIAGGVVLLVLAVGLWTLGGDPDPPVLKVEDVEPPAVAKPEAPERRPTLADRAAQKPAQTPAPATGATTPGAAAPGGLAAGAPETPAGVVAGRQPTLPEPTRLVTSPDPVAPPKPRETPTPPPRAEGARVAGTPPALPPTIEPARTLEARKPAPTPTPEQPAPGVPEPARETLAATTPTPAVEPKPPPEPAPEAIAPPVTETVPVAINATPWAIVEVDGKEIGETPLAGIRLTTGRHRFKATMPDGSIRERVIRIDADNSTVVFE